MTNAPQRVATVTEVLVCTTCRPAGQPRDETAAGQRLWQAVEVAYRGTAGAEQLQLRGFACLNSCSRACTVAFQADGKHSYCFGDLQPDATTAAQVLACALQHARSGDGNLPRNERPERLRGGILLRLPPRLEPPATVTATPGPEADLPQSAPTA